MTIVETQPGYEKPFVEYGRQFVHFLHEQGYPCRYIETDDTHSGQNVARRAVYKFLQAIFQQVARDG
jgi:hypothetical protein